MILITKLISGEELISDTELVKCDDMPVCMLIKPIQLFTVPSDNGISIQMLPWMSQAKDHTIPIGLDMILTQVEPATDIYNKYNSMFGSGIQVASSSVIASR